MSTTQMDVEQAWDCIPEGPRKGQPWVVLQARTLRNILRAVDLTILQLDGRMVAAIRRALEESKVKLSFGLRLKRGRQQEFDELMERARAGEEEAISDLWAVYGVDFRGEAPCPTLPCPRRATITSSANV